MKIPPLCLFFAAGYLLSGCYSVRQQAYYVSPINGHPNDYQPLPQTIDSTQTAVPPSSMAGPALPRESPRPGH
ncbi:MAG: hypothetical protein J0H74_13290 [Chitinophagaceae bacterium]|nr:hypothetical protein [Chitinophagaceae bacterium]